MMIKQHPGTGLWVTSDGRVIMPPCPKYPRFRFTYGHKDRKSGYMRVRFRGKNYRVHRLVAEAFNIPNPEGYKEIDHYPDRNPSNNAVSNLRWADRKMQNDNKQSVDLSLARYGVRHCENSAMYMRAYRASNPDFAGQERAKSHAYREKQKALGRRCRRCPDGKQHWLTDEEYNKRYGKS